MGKITLVEKYTTDKPLQMIGEFAGLCYGAKDDVELNIKRALDCIDSNHGRVEEFPDIYLIIEGYSAKLMRELYTHIGGSPTRLQASTRYIDYSKRVDVVTPKTVSNNSAAVQIWDETIQIITDNMKKLKELGIPTEDYTNLLPLAYKSKMVWKVNLRCLVNFMQVRLCNRAYWEMVEFAKELKKILSEYSEEWAIICEKLFKPKCVIQKRCTETRSCGYFQNKNDK